MTSLSSLRIRALLVLLLALLFAAAVSVTPAPTKAIVWAVPDKTITVEDIGRALKVTDEPASYVIVIDTSTSMQQEDRYATVRTALTALLRELHADDHLTLITFDSTARVKYDDTIGERKPDQILATLPPAPTGTQTDIGLGVAAALDELESARDSRLGSLLLITDGNIDAVPTSPYRTEDSQGWKELRARADKLATRMSVAAYAVGLGEDTGADALKAVFPTATTVPAQRLEQQLTSLRAEVTRLRIADAAEKDAARGVRVSWSGPLTGLVPGATAREVTVRITSETRAVPLVLTAPRATVTGADVVVAGWPSAIELAPGASVTVPVTVSASGAADRGSGTIALAAQVDSPWEQVITDDLDLRFAPPVRGTAAVVTVAAPTPPVPPESDAEPSTARNAVPEWAPPAGLAVAGIVVLAAIVALVVRGRRPVMSGSLTVDRGDRTIAELLLDGRRVRSTAGTGTDRVPVTVRGVRERRGKAGRATEGSKPSVTVEVRSAHRRHRATIASGESATVDDLVLTYTDHRSRVLQLVTIDRADQPSNL